MSAALEKKIASALASTTLASAALADLISDTHSAITEADATAASEKVKALDPALSPDPVKAREAMQAAEFSAARLRTVLPRLQAKAEEIRAREYLGQWQEDFAAMKQKRDGLADELRGLYPAFASKIADVLTRIQQNDLELSQLHQSRPAGVALHLTGAEATARGLESLSAQNPSVAKELKVPDWTNSAKLVWPVPMAVLTSLIAPPAFHPGPDWWRDKDKRAAVQEEDRRRLVDAYGTAQHQKEEAGR